MKYILFLFSIIWLPVFGQNAPDSNTVYTVAPRFKGDIYKYLNDSIRYPRREKDSNITGTVYMTFAVEKDGSINRVRILRGVPKGPGLDSEAIRLVSTMPAWEPGTYKGRPVRVQYNLPVRFELH